MDTIEARVRLQLDAKNGSLGYWKTVIEKTCADFQTKLPGFEPDPFASLVFAADGRSAGSNFPNLIEPGERERYGL